MLVRKAFLFIFLCVLLETSFCTSIFLPFLFPHLALLVLIYVALYDGPATGAKCGLWLGFMLDLMSSARFGSFTVLYALAGGACGALKGKVFVEAFVSQWTIPAAVYFSVLSLSLFFESNEGPWNYSEVLLRMLTHSPIVVTLLVSPLVFRALKKILRRPPAESRHLFLQ